MSKFFLRSKTAFAILSVAFSFSTSAAISVSEENGKLKIVTSVNNEFGEAPKVALHDDFDDGKNNSVLSADDGWSTGSSHGQDPVYSNAAQITGNQSAKASFLGHNYNSSAEYKHLGGLKSAYVSYYFKVMHLNGKATRNLKLARISGGHLIGYIQATGMTLFPIHKNGFFSTASIDTTTSKVPAAWYPELADGNWHRAEYFVKLSQPVLAANGVSLLRVDGEVVSNQTNVVTDEIGTSFKWLTLPYYSAHDDGGDYLVYVDNVVVSNQQAHVEFCEQPTYSLCKRPVVAKLVKWKDDSIVVEKTEINTKRNRNYVYVFGKSGNVINEKGARYCPLCPKMRLN